MSSLALDRNHAGVPSVPRGSHLTSFLTFYLALLFLLPARLVVAPLGAIGQPAAITALVAIWIWIIGRACTRELDRGRQPIRVLLVAYVWLMSLSYALAGSRPLTELEKSGSTRALLGLLGVVAIALLISDGLETPTAIIRLLDVLTTFGAVVAIVGIVQFFTDFDPTQYIRVPGLTLNRELVGIGSRSIFNRPYSTTLHPIEFGVLLAVLLPVALQRALGPDVSGAGPSGSSGRRRWIAVLLIAAAIPMSLSRSAVVAVVTAFLFLIPAWSWRRRTAVLSGCLAFLTVIWLTIPGLLGTIRSLFLNADTDPSIVSRRERFPLVVDLVERSPLFGSGFGTYSPEDYFLLDNQYFEIAIESGLAGIAAVLVLVLGGIAVCRRVALRSSDEELSGLAHATGASIAGAGVALYTFDAFSFPIFTSTLFLLIGTAGAMWRIGLRDQR